MSAFVSGSEIAFFGLTPQDIEELEENQDDDNHSKAFNLISQSERLLATILISNNLVNVTLVILLSFAISQIVVFNSPVVDFLLQTVFLTFLLLLFGEIFPKLVAKGRKKKWALFAAGPLTVVYNIVGPLAKLMARSTTLVNRVITKRADSISTDELSQALEISDVKSEQDKEMLEGILSFGEKEVSEIMVSRIDVTDIDWNSSWSEVVETILQSGFSRIPVYDKTQDNIKGVLYSKDLIPYIGKRDDSFKWQNLLRPAFFIPESKMIDDLLEDFRRKKTHIAIVVDEYGCTQGIVTLEDILEEIVGDIDDEYDEEDKLYQQLSEDTYVFEAKISLSDFCRVTGVEEEEFGEIGEVETLAGLILSLKGDFPTKNESVVGGRCRFLVLEIRRHRIISVRVKVMSEIQSDASNPED
ncbi:MAG: gliding motility-associated protein GldE [Muribaculaceae bacterium]|nr:gliding motility-associated protein GldE [Muribaculaceae bacterium]MBO7165808.1 gliding motility-associated protein GldE [Muribaculaceae bacterium]